MKYNLNLRSIILILSFIFIQKCDFNYLDPIVLKVITAQAGFDGYYVADGGNIQYFEGSVLTNGVSKYETTFKTLQSLEVTATTRSGATNITIQAYRNEKKVKEIFQDGLNQATTVSFSYTYGEETNTQSSTTTAGQ